MGRRCKCLKCGKIQDVELSEDGYEPSSCIECGVTINGIETSYKHRMDVMR